MQPSPQRNNILFLVTAWLLGTIFLFVLWHSYHPQIPNSNGIAQKFPQIQMLKQSAPTQPSENGPQDTLTSPHSVHKRQRIRHVKLQAKRKPTPVLSSEELKAEQERQKRERDAFYNQEKIKILHVINPFYTGSASVRATQRATMRSLERARDWFNQPGNNPFNATVDIMVVGYESDVFKKEAPRPSLPPSPPPVEAPRQAVPVGAAAVIAKQEVATARGEADATVVQVSSAIAASIPNGPDLSNSISNTTMNHTITVGYDVAKPSNLAASHRNSNSEVEIHGHHSHHTDEDNEAVVATRKMDPLIDLNQTDLRTLNSTITTAAVAAGAPAEGNMVSYAASEVEAAIVAAKTVTAVGVSEAVGRSDPPRSAQSQKIVVEELIAAHAPEGVDAAAAAAPAPVEPSVAEPFNTVGAASANEAGADEAGINIERRLNGNSDVGGSSNTFSAIDMDNISAEKGTEKGTEKGVVWIPSPFLVSPVPLQKSAAQLMAGTASIPGNDRVRPLVRPLLAEIMAVGAFMTNASSTYSIPFAGPLTNVQLNKQHVQPAVPQLQQNACTKPAGDRVVSVGVDNLNVTLAANAANESIACDPQAGNSPVTASHDAVVEPVIRGAEASGGTVGITVETIVHDTNKQDPNHIRSNGTSTTTTTTTTAENKEVPKPGPRLQQRRRSTVFPVWNQTRFPKTAPYGAEPYTHVIYTNIDIGVVEDFYLTVHSLIFCFDTFLINRVEIPEAVVANLSTFSSHPANESYARPLQPITEDSLDLAYTYTQQFKQLHPGFDCLVIRREKLPAFVTYLGDVYIAFPPVGRMLTRAAKYADADCVTISNMHSTFHLGTRNGDWDSDNDTQAYQVLNGNIIQERYEYLERVNGGVLRMPRGSAAPPQRPHLSIANGVGKVKTKAVPTTSKPTGASVVGAGKPTFNFGAALRHNRPASSAGTASEATSKAAMMAAHARGNRAHQQQHAAQLKQQQGQQQQQRAVQQQLPHLFHGHSSSSSSSRSANSAKHPQQAMMMFIPPQQPHHPAGSGSGHTAFRPLSQAPKQQQPQQHFHPQQLQHTLQHGAMNRIGYQQAHHEPWRRRRMSDGAVSSECDGKDHLLFIDSEVSEASDDRELLAKESSWSWSELEWAAEYEPDPYEKSGYYGGGEEGEEGDMYDSYEGVEELEQRDSDPRRRRLGSVKPKCGVKNYNHVSGIKGMHGRQCKASNKYGPPLNQYMFFQDWRDKHRRPVQQMRVVTGAAKNKKDEEQKRKIENRMKKQQEQKTHDANLRAAELAARGMHTTKVAYPHNSAAGPTGGAQPDHFSQNHISDFNNGALLGIHKQASHEHNKQQQQQQAHKGHHDFNIQMTNGAGHISGTRHSHGHTVALGGGGSGGGSGSGGTPQTRWREQHQPQHAALEPDKGNLRAQTQWHSAARPVSKQPQQPHANAHRAHSQARAHSHSHAHAHAPSQVHAGAAVKGKGS